MQFKRLLSFTLTAVLGLSLTAPVLAAEETPAPFGDVSERAVARFENDGHEFIKISHPEKPTSSRTWGDKYADGVLDYVGKDVLGVPGVDAGANGQGDRCQTYSWTGIASGDYMYVSTQYNSAMQTVDVMDSGLDHHFTPEVMDAILKALYRGDFVTAEPDDGNPGSTLLKINTKTGEIKVIMAKYLNGMNAMFRGSVEYNGKLYFVGSVNGIPSIYEVDPDTDAFQLVFADKSMTDDPNGFIEAWEKKICPTIRGITTFRDYLVVSCVGVAGNPYIAVSNHPSDGIDSFTVIAENNSAANESKGELYGYAACRLTDSIYGGSIWQMLEYNGRLYVAMCTGTPENQPASGVFQSFAIVRGECTGDVTDRNAWTWTPIAGNQERDGARFTFGIDPERTRSGACNMVVFDNHLYVGEYNDTEIALVEFLFNLDLQFWADNFEQSVSLYRMDTNEEFELVAGNPTAMFPKSLTGLYSGFGVDGPVHETQYFWQSQVFQDKLYFGTFDETSLIYPIAQFSNGDFLKLTPEEWRAQLEYLRQVIIEIIRASQKQPEGEASVLKNAASSAYGFGEFLTARDEVNEILADEEISIFSVPQTFSAEDELQSMGAFYRTALLMPAFMAQNEEWTLEEKLTSKQLFVNVYTAAYNYFNEHLNLIPEEIRQILSQIFTKENAMKLYNLGRTLYYLHDSVSGFDMFVSEDGLNFETVTDCGMGDPYNHGLRAFAANTSEENPWMCIGTANPFYGTQIWRMEGDGLNLPPVPTEPAPKPEPKPEPEYRPSHHHDDVTVTFLPADGCTLDAQKGTSVRKDGSVRVTIRENARLTEARIPAAVPTDAFYQVTGWAAMDHHGSLEKIDLETYRFSRDTAVYAVCEDVWSPFCDMKADRSDWFYQELRDLSVRGIVGGYADGAYHAEEQVTWGAALKLVMLAAGYSEQAQVPGTGHACSGYLALAKAQGVVSADAVINLYQPITRVEFAQITARALQLDAAEIDNPFTDTDDADAIALNEAGIINGYGDGRFGPQDAIKRSHIAAIIWRVNQYLEK